MTPPGPWTIWPPRYTHMSDEKVTSINQVTNLAFTTDVLLFGTEEVSDYINVSVFKAVQKYINSSKQFAN